MNRLIVRKNVTFISVIIFIILFFGTTYFKPDFLYLQDGSLRTFGVGYKRKTILPIWLFAILLGIVSYLIVLFYLSYPKLRME